MHDAGFTMPGSSQLEPFHNFVYTNFGLLIDFPTVFPVRESWGHWGILRQGRCL